MIFLKWIEKNLIYNINSGDAKIDQQIKLLKINNKVRENIIYLLGRQLSTNPGICTFNNVFNTSSAVTNAFISYYVCSQSQNCLSLK